MRVDVLMSTYNGEKFIEEQVASILEQLPVDGRLMIRDDGSTDNTVGKLQAFKDERIVIEQGKNIGFAKSFLTLLNQTPNDVQLVMFSDQDDVWLKGKLQRAWECLSAFEDQAVLYCSRQLIVNRELQVLEVSEKIQHEPSFMNAIAENIVTGCTAAINEQAIHLLKMAGVPAHVRFHDWWLYLVISAHGVVMVDDKALVLYRQHGQNYLGRGAGWLDRHVKMFKFIHKNDWVGALMGQLVELRKSYWATLTKDDQKIIEKYIELSGEQSCARWKLIFSLDRWTRNLLRDLLFRYLLLIHRVNKKLFKRQA